MRFVKGFWWLIVTVLATPVALPVLCLGRMLEWMGETMMSFYDWMCDQKHRLAPYPPPSAKRQAEIEASADADL